MPLIVGIRDEKKREVFTDEEGSFLASFHMGMIAMSAGIGRIQKNEKDTSKYSNNIPVDVATDRFNLVWNIHEKEESPFTAEFVQRMADADWESNVGNMKDDEFAHNLKERLFDEAVRGYDNIRRPSRLQWSDKKAQDTMVKNFIGIYLSGETHYYDDFTKDMVQEFAQVFDLSQSKPIYHDANNTPLYLVWDEDSYEWELSKTKEEW
jgi:hypothetical protein|tara:strand:+ start:105 stop:728 length:624 start_codon:yes stop_codon:yes gene_type:complete